MFWVKGVNVGHIWVKDKINKGFKLNMHRNVWLKTENRTFRTFFGRKFCSCCLNTRMEEKKKRTRMEKEKESKRTRTEKEKKTGMEEEEKKKED